MSPIEYADAKIKSIQTGGGVNRADFPERMKGRIAERLWNDETFAYGMEYGYLLAMIELRRAAT